MILCIFNVTINIFHSSRFECIHSPVCLITALPSLLLIENIPPLMIKLLAPEKNDALESMIKIVSSPSTGTIKFRPFMDIWIWILRLGMWMSRSLVRLLTFMDKVSVLVFQSIDRHTVTSCRRCVFIERAVCEKFTDTLLSSMLHTSNLSSNKSNRFLNNWHPVVISSMH